MNALKRLFQFCLLQVFFAYLSLAEIKPTMNACHHDVLPQEVVELLQTASVKYLNSKGPKDYSKKLEEVTEKLLQLNDTFFIMNDEKNEKIPVFEQFLKYQQRYGQMLTAVINQGINLENDISTIRARNGEITTTLSALVSSEMEGSEILSNMTKLLNQILMDVSISSVEILGKIESTGRARNGDGQQESLRIQRETNALVKNLVDSNFNERYLKEKVEKLEEKIKTLQAEKDKLLKAANKIKSRPSDCQDIYISGQTSSGIYDIYPFRCYCSKPIRVWCDMKTEGGGWTVLMSRRSQTSSVNFTRSYADYQTGFGDPAGEYWIGNEIIHAMTSNGHYTVRIDMMNRSRKKRWGQWNTFYVASHKDDYELKVKDFSQFSTIGKDVLRKHNRQLFSTFDRDNDSSFDKNCASKYKGGWWYNRCYDIHPTGILGDPDRKKSVATSYFYYGRKSLIPLKSISLKIKPNTCASHTLDSVQQSDPITCKAN